MRSAHGLDGDALVSQIAAEMRCERLDGDLVADPFDQHGCAAIDSSDV
jgi:hypothetical protein